VRLFLRTLVLLVIGVPAFFALLAVVSLAISLGWWFLPWADLDQAANVAVPYGFGAVLILLAVLVYFVPSLVAFRHKHRHHNAVAILALNPLLGWTLLGWVAALVWALTKPPPAPTAVTLLDDRSSI
jgi:hypothetical protein